jgi:hypothetical protein
LRITGDQQFPLLPTGFSEYNTNVTVQANQDLSFTLGHRYIYGNPFFPDSSLIQFGTYYRINDNWGFSIAEQYEMADHTLEQQTYQIHRDLSSWIATFGLLFRNNATSTVASKTEFGFMITFTLKDLPQISIPFGESPSTGGNVKGL